MIDKLTEIFSIMETMGYEQDEANGKIDYPALWQEMIEKVDMFLANPQEVRQTRHYLRIVTLMRFFGVDTDPEYAKNKWRIKEANIDPATLETLMKDKTEQWVFWQPPA